MFGGLGTINVELTSRCNKSCWCCGRRKIERDYPELVNWGDMDYELVKSISRQLPEGIVVQFHNNGEPLLYPRLGEALALFTNQIRCLDTNGKLLVEKAEEIIDNLDTITISTIKDDPEQLDQWLTIQKFLELKKNRKPEVIIRCTGNDPSTYSSFGCLVVTRVLHSPMGSFAYQKEPVIPEIGICLELLHHLSIDRFGDVSPCVRFDPKKENVLGTIISASLVKIWAGERRKTMLDTHISGNRARIGFCARCEYWGIPQG